MGAHSVPQDASTADIWPPPIPSGETAEELQSRLAEEMAAKKVSDEIDRAIELDKQEMRSRQPDVKILLLGQAESGKSTVLKNFQLLFAPQSFHAEAEAWGAVVRLNLVRSVNFVLDLLEESASLRDPHRSPSLTGNDDLQELKMRLVPLRSVEIILKRRFCSTNPTSDGPGKSHYHPDRASEVSVRSGWKVLLKHQRGPTASNELEDSRRIIEACKDDVVSLWNSPRVQEVLKVNAIRLQDQPGFFLSDVTRIVSRKYIPTPDDILRARLQTIGVEEHRITMETDAERGSEWMIYDVGGSRGQRAVWASFVDDVNVVIFLAPVSVFNQTLAEKKSVNRLFDSLELWKQTCGNALLRSAHFVILFNKCDILDAKLKSGIMFSKYVTSYKHPNDLENVTKYLKTKFVGIHHQLTPNAPKPRQLYTHLTCATDTRATSVVLNRIRDAIVIHALTSTNLL